MLLLTRSCSGKRTNLGSGLHHKISSPSYQGNIPLLYASNKRSTERSPPMAKRPSGSANSGGGNTSSLSSANNGIFKFELYENKLVCFPGVGKFLSAQDSERISMV